MTKKMMNKAVSQTKIIKTALFLTAVLAFSLSHSVEAREVKATLGVTSALPHLDLEMSSVELAQILEAREGAISVESEFFSQADSIKGWLAVGKRNLEWIDQINRNRPPESQLELSSPALTVGIPIETPNESGRKILGEKIDSLTAALPDSIKSVVLMPQSSDSLNSALQNEVPEGMSDEEFLGVVRKIDRLYQGCSRWLLQEPYLWQYGSLQSMDIRGYYFLSKNPDQTALKLNSFKTLSEAEQKQIKEWLVSMCLNGSAFGGATQASCLGQIDQAVKREALLKYYQSKLNISKSKYDSFFNIESTRSDLVWSGANAQTLSAPFRAPVSGPQGGASGAEAVRQWLQTNIEDEWHFQDWALKLVFSDHAATEVVFEAGATPHVNGLSGDTITMDANRPIQEYSSRWTIRHEYGHTLGFPDCYIEYYDRAREVMVNYQIDVDNLMCSRKGHLQQRHYDELRRHYFVTSQ